MIHVSDHALVRFLERSGALDVEAVRQALASSLARASRAAQRVGIDDYEIVADGLRYVVREGILVTVTPPERFPPR
ncbi:hypothetical protein [Bosea sp. FBZP-16]|uniref:hypothetical protein n=1 Tax=Bosea sp. FBZP-16 TaxID=2065382 RepID=UPI000C303A07|nr:hypothetical protein [Bosea sp. FBZP-16]